MVLARAAFASSGLGAVIFLRRFPPFRQPPEEHGAHADDQRGRDRQVDLDRHAGGDPRGGERGADEQRHAPRAVDRRHHPAFEPTLDGDRLDVHRDVDQARQQPDAEEEQGERRETRRRRQEREPHAHRRDAATDDPSTSPPSDRRIRHTRPGQQPHREARQGDPQPGGVQPRLLLDVRDPRPEEARQHRVRRERGRHPDPRAALGALIPACRCHRESLCDAARNRHIDPTTVR